MSLMSSHDILDYEEINPQWVDKGVGTPQIQLDTMSQRPWVRFWGPKIAAASCTHLGPVQVMEVIIIDV